jgi:hypothetical protein
VNWHEQTDIYAGVVRAREYPGVRFRIHSTLSRYSAVIPRWSL